MRFAVESRTTRELSRRVAQHRERIEETAAIPTSFFFLSFLPFVLPPNLFFSLFPAPYFFSALPRFRLSFVSFLSLPVVEPRSLSTSRRLPPPPSPDTGLFWRPLIMPPLSDPPRGYISRTFSTSEAE